MLHPFHIHGTQFRILSENGKPPAPHRQGWKDIVNVDGWRSEVLVRFNYVAAAEQAYMAHCHLLEHEDTGMMPGFTVSAWRRGRGRCFHSIADSASLSTAVGNAAPGYGWVIFSAS